MRSWLCGALLSCAVSSAIAAAPGYIATPLGSLGGVSIYATGINASGQISGWGDTDAAGAAHRHAFLHSNGVLTNLGTLAGGTQSFGWGISDAGKVVGASNVADGGVLRAALFDNATIVDLNASLGAQQSTAYAINVAGQLAGGLRLPGAATTRAYRHEIASGTTADLGTLGGSTSQAYGINVFGAVTGFAHVLTQDAHAFRFDAGGLIDLGTLGGPASLGQAINASGQVVGFASLPGNGISHAFFHDGATMHDIGTLGGVGSSALGINSAGTIVGEATNAQGAARAFVYADGAMIDLNTVTTGLNGAVVTTATAINEAGQIVAMSCTAPLVCSQAFRLDPVPAPKAAAIEYHHAAFDHYFVTALPDEIAKLDNGTFAGWSRTGGTFNVYLGDQAGTRPVCRFFSTSFSPKSSHFYTPDAGECAIIRRNADWQLEGIVFNVGVPDDKGNCAAGTQPVYRLYNNGMGAAPNHRYTTSLATRAQMLAQGWIPEGYGPDAVAICAPT